VKSHRLLILLMLSLAACSPLLDVHAGPVGPRDLASRSHFSMSTPIEAPPGYGSSGRTDEVVRRAEVIATKILLSKGYGLANDGSGELYVHIGGGHRADTASPILPIPLPSGRQAARIEMSEREDIAEGALIIDVFESPSGAMVWHGAARVAVDPAAIDEDLLERATAAILATFPVHVRDR
jgi:hypothetical protein